jgi:hypothetical protein
MGGDYYDRDIGSAGSDASYSNAANIALSSGSLHPSLCPTRFSDVTLKSEYHNPIVFGLDVTGSMGEWSKVKLYKLHR